MTSHFPAPLLRSAAEYPTESYDWGTLAWLVDGRAAAHAQQTFGLATIYPGHGNPRHLHPNCEEILYVVSGRCRHAYGESWFDLAGGSTLLIPAGVPHQLINTGAEPVVCIISFSSPNRQTVFAEV